MSSVWGWADFRIFVPKHESEALQQRRKPQWASIILARTLFLLGCSVPSLQFNHLAKLYSHTQGTYHNTLTKAVVDGVLLPGHFRYPIMPGRCLPTQLLVNIGLTL